MIRCLFLREQKCTNQMCDTYNDFPSEHYCNRCPYKTQNGGLERVSTEDRQIVRQCGNCAYYVKKEESNFYHQCVKKGLKNPDDTCKDWSDL